MRSKGYDLPLIITAVSESGALLMTEYKMSALTKDHSSNTEKGSVCVCVLVCVYTLTTDI